MLYLDSSLGRYQGGNDPGREHLAMRGSEWMSMTEHDVCTGRGIDAGSKKHMYSDMECAEQRSSEASSHGCGNESDGDSVGLNGSVDLQRGTTALQSQPAPTTGIAQKRRARVGSG